MVVVTKKKGETKDSLFRKFTRAFIDEEIVEKLREIQFYKKPSRRRLEKLKGRGPYSRTRMLRSKGKSTVKTGARGGRK